MVKLNKKNKDVVAGIGEIGDPIMKLLTKATYVVGYDKNPKLVDSKKLQKSKSVETKFLHICIPFNESFAHNFFSLCKKFNPQIIVIHSTISPGTIGYLQKKITIPLIYSATRGTHKRMLSDLKRYTKFFAIESNAPNGDWASKEYSKLMRHCNVKTKRMTNPLTLELAKIIVDTSYYGWLINYAQISNMIAIKHKVDYEEMWSFADEIHKNLGNRPKMFPGFIGGHCVIPNLSLIDDESLWQIDKINNIYAKKVSHAKLINSRYDK